MPLHTPQKCRARNRQGDRCGRWAIAGGAVCNRHGGAAPQVREAAQARLAALVNPALGTMAYCIKQRKDLKVAYVASKDVLDRNNLVGKTLVEHSGDVTVTRIERVIVDPAEPAE